MHAHIALIQVGLLKCFSSFVSNHSFHQKFCTNLIAVNLILTRDLFYTKFLLGILSAKLIIPNSDTFERPVKVLFPIKGAIYNY